MTYGNPFIQPKALQIQRNIQRPYGVSAAFGYLNLQII